jgi:hypothetical protein
MTRMTLTSRTARAAAAAIAGATAAGGLFLTSPDAVADQDGTGDEPVDVKVLSPRPGGDVGISGSGWFIDLAVDFATPDLAATGFTGVQLTGPGGHNNIPPAPGAFGTGRDDRMPGLVVLASTTSSALPGFSGPGTNLAGLFNLTGVTDRSDDEIELSDTWLVGAPVAGSGVDSVLTVAVVDDLDHDGIYDDAPNVVPDSNGDGRVDRRDLQALGVASHVVRVPFHISGAPA